MKKMYYAISGFGDDCEEIVQKFRHFPEALAFVNSTHQQQQYHGLHLFCRTGSNAWQRYTNDGAWVECSRDERVFVKYHTDQPPLEFVEGKSDWIDLRASERVTLKAGEFAIIPLGVSMKLPEGFEAHVLPRSSTFKRWGILMANSMGIIDNSFSGDNDVWGFPAYATRDTIIEAGDRICQFRLMPKMTPVKFCSVDHLEGPDRGGFGSTGVK